MFPHGSCLSFDCRAPPLFSSTAKPAERKALFTPARKSLPSMFVPGSSPARVGRCSAEVTQPGVCNASFESFRCKATYSALPAPVSASLREREIPAIRIPAPVSLLISFWLSKANVGAPDSACRQSWPGNEVRPKSCRTSFLMLYADFPRRFGETQRFRFADLCRTSST